MAGSADVGGLALDGRASRRVFAAIAGGCGATFFVWAQHHGVVRTIASSPNQTIRDELLVPLCRGERIAGVAFAHLRRPGPPAIRATRVAGGWRLDGHAPWATSWGIAADFAIAAATDDGELVWAIVSGRPGVGMAVEPLRLPVFGATGTVAMDFDGFEVVDESVADVVDLTAWRQADRRHAALGNPAVLGVAERAVRLLGELGDDDSAGAAGRLGDAIDDAWSADERLAASLAAADVAGVDDVIATASAHRARCLDLSRRATTALLAAVGGRGMALDHPAQRLAREANFYVIQAQTADGRAATLASA